MSATSRRTSGLVAAVAVLLLASCAEGGSGAPTAAPSASVTPSATESATPAPTASETGASEPDAPIPFPADVAVDEQPSSDDAALTLTDVTTGQHEGYDRVVFHLGGTGTPGWIVRYVDTATDDPADTVLDIDGDGTLSVILLGFQLPTTTGITEWGGPNPIRTPDYEELREVNVRGQFEGQELAYLGLDSTGEPFRVFALTDPTRVVVDVQDVDDDD
ncbi:AMIN-like domain-containing (lipo)protein [Cellulomonas fengjieae]|uniref:AMIN-like domain-containing (lipo)protein n=1 Tax=Cellulomonas fengjieae TaxID=2819978 RepID=UPI001AAE85AE|nr:hypothetical protein [Cellulomonas fengjieae]MBO3103774.1 hypothetical protein [Cellulomonas fengjieae]